MTLVACPRYPVALISAMKKNLQIFFRQEETHLAFFYPYYTIGFSFHVVVGTEKASRRPHVEGLFFFPHEKNVPDKTGAHSSSVFTLVFFFPEINLSFSAVRPLFTSSFPKPPFVYDPINGGTFCHFLPGYVHQGT